MREIDALGGEMGRAIDDTFIQSRMLNTSKGPAVLSLRAQADKRAYQRRMRAALEHQQHLTVRQGECARIDTRCGQVESVVTLTGARYRCRAAIVCTGVYLKSRIIIGEATWQAGPQGLFPAGPLSDALTELGFELRRFKTGTPARVDVRSIDFDKMIPQPGDDPITPFSFMTEGELKNRAMCYLTYTTPQTHKLIRDNIALAPGYSGLIRGTGARYCPSIEDKVMRFADKERHPILIEPPGPGHVRVVRAGHEHRHARAHAVGDLPQRAGAGARTADAAGVRDRVRLHRPTSCARRWSRATYPGCTPRVR